VHSTGENESTRIMSKLVYLSEELWGFVV